MTFSTLSACRRRRSRRRRSQFLQWHRGVSQPFADVLPGYLAPRLSWIELLESPITALAYSPELAFLSLGGRWRGSFGSYLNKSGLDRAGVGLSLRAAIRCSTSLCDGLSSCGLFERAIFSVAASVVSLVVLAGFDARCAGNFDFATIRLRRNRFTVLAAARSWHFSASMSAIFSVNAESKPGNRKRSQAGQI